MAEDAKDILSRAAGIRRMAITSEQAERRRQVDERNTLMQQHGVKAPASGTFGKPAK